MRPLDMYPDNFGAHKGSVFPHAGPASYTAVVEVSPADFPVTGGDIVEAVEAGLKLFDWIASGSLTDDGAYRVEVIPLTLSDDQVGAPSRTMVLRWVVVATGAEVAGGVDLSDRVVRLFALGPK